jgi:hypothetical protein
VLSLHDGLRFVLLYPERPTYDCCAVLRGAFAQPERRMIVQERDDL